MYLVYLDESGDPTPPPRSGIPFYIISAFLMRPDAMRIVEEKVDNIYGYLREKGVNTEKLEELKGSEIWRKIRKKCGNNMEEAKNIFRGIYDIIHSEEFTIIAVAVDKEKYINETVLGRELDGIRRSTINTINSISNSPYFSVLGNPNVRRQVNIDAEEGFNELKSRFIGNLIKYQATNDILVRIEKFLEKEEEEGILLFDADAKTISSSIYSFLARSFRRDGMALRHDTLLQPEKIVHHLLIDSKLDHALQLADIIAYGIREILQFEDKEIYSKLEPMLDKGPRNETWGFGFKIIPWREEDLRRIIE
ncbi:MAG: DUF3800 domain-containing protein [Staphylothermus sp.]|nr:DUF3800 domain-containing protein [Staphylothermus sp.]